MEIKIGKENNEFSISKPFAKFLRIIEIINLERDQEYRVRWGPA